MCRRPISSCMSLPSTLFVRKAFKILMPRKWKWLESAYEVVLASRWQNLQSPRPGPGGAGAQLGLHSTLSEAPNCLWFKESASLLRSVGFLLSFLNDGVCSICWKLLTDFLVCLHIEINRSEFSQLYVCKDRVFVFNLFHIKITGKRNKNSDFATRLYILKVRFIVQHGPWRNIKVLLRW